MGDGSFEDGARTAFDQQNARAWWLGLAEEKSHATPRFSTRGPLTAAKPGQRNPACEGLSIGPVAASPSCARSDLFGILPDRSAPAPRRHPAFVPMPRPRVPSPIVPD